jgi:hypothetical protein
VPIASWRDPGPLPPDMALGTRQGPLRIVGYDHREGATLVLCVCLCGEVLTAAPDALRTYPTQLCPCCTPQRGRLGDDMVIGSIWGSLTLIGYAPPKHTRGGRQAVCLCRCGRTTTARPSHLRIGHTTSCGCGQFGSEVQRRRAQKLWGGVYSGRRHWHGGRPKKRHPGDNYERLSA